jgi:xanthine dehydrogenase small subunit
VIVPKLKPDERFRRDKVSKRFDQDISTVMAAFKLRMKGTHIVAASHSAAWRQRQPKRARAVEAARCGVDVADAMEVNPPTED